MTSTARVSFLTIDGLTYAVAREGAQSSVKRSHQAIEPAQLRGLRVQPPFLTSETQGFEDGEGLRTRDDVATGYAGGLGVEPHTEVPTTGHLRLKVGRALSEAINQAGIGGIVAQAVYKNELWLVAKSGANIYSWDGTTLTAHDASGFASSVTSVVADRRRDMLYFGGYSGGTTGQHIFQWNGSIFQNIRTLGPATKVFVIGVYVTGTDSMVWAWYETATPAVVLFTCTITGGVDGVKQTWDGQNITAAIQTADTVYFWITDFGDTRQAFGQLHTWASSGTGTLATPGVLIQDNYPVSAEVYRGDLYIGMAWGGSVRKVEGSVVTEVLHVGATAPPAAVPGTDAIYALRVYGDSLYAAGYDAAAASGQRTWLRRYTGDGWHPISAGGNDASTAIRSLGVFEQTLTLGDEEASAGRLYELSTTSRLTAARLDTAYALYGATGVRKRFVHAALQHSPLVAGQAIELRTVLDDGAESSVGINRDVGSTETAFVLPATVLGTRLQCRWYLTNVAGSDLLLASDSVTALPAPPSREVWQADLQLAADAYDAADTRTELDRYGALQALQDAGAVFQVVHEYRDAAGVPLLAMRAAFDPQVPLETRDLGIGGGVMSAVAPVRLVQAAQPENLAKNASFEQDGNGATPTDWGTVIGSGTSALTDNGAAQDGTYSLKVILNGAASYGRSQSVSGLVPGRIYTLSAYLRRTTWATALANPRVDVFESGILTSGNSVGPGAGAATDAAFVRYSQTFLYPLTGSGTVLVRAFADGTPANGSTVLFDAIQMEEGSPASVFKERGSGG